jgi:hypothetical protein
MTQHQSCPSALPGILHAEVQCSRHVLLLCKQLDLCVCIIKAGRGAVQCFNCVLYAAPMLVTAVTNSVLMHFASMQMGQDLTYSERILRFMKLCCCFGFFCSCCTEPERANSDRKWRGSG